MELSSNVVSQVKGGGLITAYPTRAFAITPSDETEWTSAVTVYCNTAGDVAVMPFEGDTAITFTMAAGGVVPVVVRQVLSTGTTVSINLIGVY